MNLFKKPPLPKAHIIEVRPEFFSPSLKTRKQCNEFNRKESDAAKHEFKKFKKELTAWRKESRKRKS